MQKGTNLRTAAKKAFRSTDVFRLRKLQEERRKWQRRETIAQNKLAIVRNEIENLCLALANDKAGIKPEELNDTRH